jgi:hypothetical protein
MVDKAELGRVFSPSTSVSLANYHSTNFSIIIITRSWHNRPIVGRSAEWTQLDFTPPPYQFKKKNVVEMESYAMISFINIGSVRHSEVGRGDTSTHIECGDLINLLFFSK